MSDGTTIRALATHAEYQACVALQEEIWGAGFTERVPPALLKVAQEVGGVSAGAFDAGGVLIGFVFGLTGLRDGRLVHWSDILAVREAYRGRGIGARLKAWQRDHVHALGVMHMYWTFDPLVAANAHLNFTRLGARAVEYRIDMYGSHTGSALHGGMPTDRFVIEWDLTGAPLPAWHGDPRDFPLLNPVSDGGVPRVVEVADTPGYRVQVPRDLTAVQHAGGDLALRWRLAVRQAAEPLFARGLRPVRFDEPGNALPYYVFSDPHAVEAA